MIKQRGTLALAGIMLGAGLLTASPVDAQTGKKPAAKAQTGTSGKKVASKKTTAKKLNSGIDLAAMDKTASPRKDFNQYVNGAWLKKTEIPATESRWGSFNELNEKNRKLLREILETAAKNTNAPKGSTAQLIGDFFASGMDSAGIEKAGYNPIKPELARIQGMKTSNDIVYTIAHLQRNGIYPLFSVFVEIDAKNSSEYALYANQGGIGLPDRDYYFKTDERTVKIRTEYLAHITRTLQLIGYTPVQAAEKARAIMEMETELADASMTRVEMRDPYATYNKKDLGELQAMAPNFNWANYLRKAGFEQAESVIVGQPKFYEKAGNMLATRKIEDWKSYLEWHLVRNTSRFLSSAFVDESFAFNGKVLGGRKAQEPRWKRVQSVTDAALGEAVGQEYVKVAFTPEAKKRMMAMVENLKAALKDRINGLEWMSAETKKKAQEKLATIVTKIGYPDKWRDYSGLVIDRNSYMGNIMRVDSVEWVRMANKLGKPIDKSEWGMTPPTINAYYNPSMNEIVFPAGILQAPFFDPTADDAVNYGGIGAVIGHELTHGFDDEGRKFDAQGNLKEWWTEEDAHKFDARTGIVVKQFDSYVAVDSLHINGKLTLGENIADLGGLTIAYDAYKRSLQGKPGEVMDGFTPDQRFFIGWAQVWRNKARDEFVRQQVLTDPHSPAVFRVNGPLSNLPEFHKAFGLQPGDPMMRPESERARIW